jgi:hypothetical protein
MIYNQVVLNLGGRAAFSNKFNYYGKRKQRRNKIKQITKLKAMRKVTRRGQH